MKTLMAIIGIIGIMLSGVVFADQRMETVGGFCHAVTPEGFATANDDNEVFISNCISSIRQKANATGEGSYVMAVTYPSLKSMPFTAHFKTNGADTGIACVMVDSNGTTYATQDWASNYRVVNRKAQPAKYAQSITTCNGTTCIAHPGALITPAKPALHRITYKLECYNGAQQ